MANEIRVKPTSWSPRGEAIATGPGGVPVVVWNGVVGEEAVVRVNHRGQNQWAAYFVETDHPHPERVPAPCKKFVSCGGCPTMHLTEKGQWGVRRALVANALSEHDLADVTIGAQHECPDGQEGYRHLIKLGAGYSDQRHIRLGAWGRRTRSVVPIPKCSVATPILGKVMRSLAQNIIDLNIHPYLPETDEGVLRSVVVRASRSTGEVLVTLVVGRRDRALSELAERVSEEVSNIVGVWLHRNNEEGNAIFARDMNGHVGVRAVLGKSWIEEELNGVRYRIGPGDFFQTNPATAEVLYQRVMDRLELSNGDTFVDLYSGVGGLALQGARRAGWALGIEEVPGAVERARESTRINGLTAEFMAEFVVHALPEIERRLGDRGPIVTVNPARRGLEEGVIEGILGLKPRRLAYVSCNPRSLARDLVRFRDAGWKIGELELFDMFPNTPHVETFVVLESPGMSSIPTVRPPKRRKVRKS
jgi:23S rRNA (uracil1939-C5)-methyltransferase